MKQDAKQVIDMFEGQVSINKRLSWCGLSASSFYYKAGEGKPGRKPSTVTLKTDGTVVGNDCVVDEIKSILGIEFLCYGYIPITDELFDRGYLINHKKVYRLMCKFQFNCIPPFQLKNISLDKDKSLINSYC